MSGFLRHCEKVVVKNDRRDPILENHDYLYEITFEKSVPNNIFPEGETSRLLDRRPEY